MANVQYVVNVEFEQDTPNYSEQALVRKQVSDLLENLFRMNTDVVDFEVVLND